MGYLTESEHCISFTLLHLCSQTLDVFHNPGISTFCGPGVLDGSLTPDNCGCCLQIVTVALLSSSGKHPQEPEGATASPLWERLLSMLLHPPLKTWDNPGEQWSSSGHG